MDATVGSQASLARKQFGDHVSCSPAILALATVTAGAYANRVGGWDAGVAVHFLRGVSTTLPTAIAEAC
jgi:hypothetical protein